MVVRRAPVPAVVGKLLEFGLVVSSSGGLVVWWSLGLLV